MAGDLCGTAEELERIGESDFWSKVKLQLILSLVEGPSILDVGCGAGRLSKALSDRGYRVTAVDCDEKAFEITARKGVEAFKADFVDWETPVKFDCVVLADVLEHIEDDESALRKIHHMLNQGGCVVLNVPAYQFLFGRHDVSLGHKRRYSASVLKSKLEAAGFEVVYFRHWDLLVLPMTIFTKISKRDYPLEKISNIPLLSHIAEKLLIFDSRTDYVFGLSILCKARSVSTNE